MTTRPKCEACGYETPCTSLDEMRARHGSPFAFARAVERAADNLEVTTQEASDAAAKYRATWQRMADWESTNE